MLKKPKIVVFTVYFVCIVLIGCIYFKNLQTNVYRDRQSILNEKYEEIVRSTTRTSFNDSIIKLRRNVINISVDVHGIDAGDCVIYENKLRCLPSFIIVGAMKSGTGELMKWLCTNPLIHVCRD